MTANRFFIVTRMLGKHSKRMWPFSLVQRTHQARIQKGSMANCWAHLRHDMPVPRVAIDREIRMRHRNLGVGYTARRAIHVVFFGRGIRVATSSTSRCASCMARMVQPRRRRPDDAACGPPDSDASPCRGPDHAPLKRRLYLAKALVLKLLSTCCSTVVTSSYLPRFMPLHPAGALDTTTAGAPPSPPPVAPSR